jgi:hypothetical protein
LNIWKQIIRLTELLALTSAADGADSFKVPGLEASPSFVHEGSCTLLVVEGTKYK